MLPTWLTARVAAQGAVPPPSWDSRLLTHSLLLLGLVAVLPGCWDRVPGPACSNSLVSLLPSDLNPGAWLICLLHFSFLLLFCKKKTKNKKTEEAKKKPRASLVVQWLRICLLMQGTRV